MLKKFVMFIGVLVLMIAIYGYFRLFAGRPGELPNPEGTTSHYVTATDGTKIHYLTMGSGVPILLIHGYFANADLNWFKNGIAQELAKTNLVIAMDNRGHGRSDKPYSSQSYGAHMWQDALLVLDDMKIDKAHIHGYSMGGSILTQILFHAPERVLTATYGGAGIPEYNEAIKKQVPQDKIATEIVKAEETQAKKVVKYGFAHDYIAMIVVVKNAPWDGPEHKKIDLTQVKIPVLSITGEYDSPNWRTHRLKRELPNYRSIVLPGKAHLTAITEGFMPKEYLTESVNFIRNYDKKATKQEKQKLSSIQ